MNNVAKSVKWYISSDSYEVKRNLQTLHPDKVLLSQGKPLHIAQDKAGYSGAIIDIELLSRTDMIVMTGGSTFGMVSCLKSGRLNYVISRDRKFQKMTLIDPGHTPNYHYSF